MKADDRQVIRSALEKVWPVLAAYHSHIVHDLKQHDATVLPLAHECQAALALLDKPQPESAGDARELASEIHKKCVVFNQFISVREFKEALAAEMLTAFASRIRAVALEEADELCQTMINTSPRKPFQEAAAWLQERISSLTTTGTP